MPEFNELQNQLQRSRANKERARTDLFEAREQVKKIEAEQAALDRVFNPDDPGHQKERERLNSRLERASASFKDREEKYQAARKAESGLFTEFFPFSDPREQMTRLSDDFPFLLLPVRIETRFKTIAVDDRSSHQLWVRIYPDDCAIDSFEAQLSEGEVRAGRNFWIEIWRAGGVEDGERAAWRGIVGNYGSGRSAWITQRYVPLNSKPAKAGNDDIILVIATETALSDAERQAVRDFWKAIWLADGDKAREDEAREGLEAAVGSARAAELIEQYAPFNLNDRPGSGKAKSDVASSVEFLLLPNPEDLATKQHSWTQPPKINVLPDRFVLIGYSAGKQVFEVIGNPIRSPLVVGPDPSAVPDEQLRQEGSEVVVSDEMRWMVDFDRAVEWGMGFRVDLDEAQRQAGFDRLLVLGVRLSADEMESKRIIEDLIDNHYFGRNGFSMLAQGTPTNNVESADEEEGGAGFSRSEDPDDSFDYYFRKQSQFEITDDWFRKRDGQWLAEFLGIDEKVLQKVSRAEGTDQSETRAMNVALWPATLGYWMETMMHPLFDDDHIEATRWFFTHFISGRGPVPAIRIGAQPYGILPTTALSRAQWVSADGARPVAGLRLPGQFQGFFRQFPNVLKRIDADWMELAKRVSFVGKPGDAHQTLLDVVGLHSGSVEYYQRYAESLQQLFNRLNLQGFGGVLIAAGYVESGMQLLRALGYAGDAKPEILDRFFLSSHNLLKGPVVDDVKLSETRPLREYTTDHRNYIQWLIDAARNSLETLRLQSGFTENKVPSALLYLMLRHALMESYWDASLRLYLSAQILEPAGVKDAREEAAFIHIAERTSAGAATVMDSNESRWELLYRPEARITGSQSKLLWEHIPDILTQSGATAYLREQIDALEYLKNTPTARLERVFAEHIDCCTYRLDAWQMGLLNYRLSAMRYVPEGEGVHVRKGVYLGAYGWLEDVRPENKALTPVELDAELDGIFNQNATEPLVRDSANGGYIHAPSLNHAVTAAVLRNGYLSNATAANSQTLAVNLSSERVRLALSILEGIRGGQSLGALLGYQFERGLHDRHNLAEVDEFIFKLRKEFPLRSNRLSTTRAETDEDGNPVSIEAIEARNVVDGLGLVDHLKQSGDKLYPFGRPLPPATPAQAGAINTEVDRILDIHDAVADLAIAEGVHQAAQGNFDRLAATMDAYSKGNFPPEPDVAHTPRSGTTLTHRVAVQLEPGLPTNVSPVTDIPQMTPRAKAEPAVNRWLAGILPAPADAGCKVKYIDPATNQEKEVVVTQKDLALQPIDLLYLLQMGSQQAMSELDDRILRHISRTFAPRPDRAITIRYTDRLGDRAYSFFELAPHINSLRSILLRSRPLRSSDVALGIEAQTAQDESVFVDSQRLTEVKTDLGQLLADLTAFHTQPQFQDIEAHRNTILDEIDDYIDQVADLFPRAAVFGIPQSGWGFAYEAKRQAFIAIRKKVDELIERWNERLNEFDQLINEYDEPFPVKTDEEKFELLRRAERLVSTEIAPLPASPDDLKTAIELKHTAFVAKRDQFIAVLDTSDPSLDALLESVGATLPVTTFDLMEFKLDNVERQILTLASDMVSVARTLAAEIDRRITATDRQLAAYDATTTDAARVEALQGAAKLMLGDDFQLVPEFALTEKQGDEWEKAWNARAELLDHLTNDLQSDFPVDEWLYGISRVREKIRHWEQVVMLAEAFGKTAPELYPIQLPFKAHDSWLAMPFPKGYKLDSERLLYTAHYSVPFQKNAANCGLLIDEWTEVIPATEETTGITFHHDRPNSEPPQVMLLVTPPDLTGQWEWADLVDALNETLDWLKRRAVEPVHVDDQPYAWFLPSTVSAATLYPISIALAYAANNHVYQFMSEESHG
jgi:hypothetical protein